MDAKLALAERIRAVLAAPPFSQGATAEEIAAQLAVPKETRLGDLAYPCFPLAKALKQPPPKIAADLAAALNASPDLGASAEAAGPYLNFRFDKARQFAELIPSILDGRFQAARPAKAERVMIEYSQPNTHKVFHVGHCRNVALGDAMVRLSRWAGHDVVAANYIGDVGTHIAKCLWYFRNHHQGDVPATHRGAFLGAMYVAADRMLDLGSLTAAPFPGVLTAEVIAMVPHPTHAGPPPWSVVTLDVGGSERQVVCGGSGFTIGDVVAWVKPGTRLDKRRIDVSDREGVKSEGMICSGLEIGLGTDKQRIHTFAAGTPLGVEIAEVMRKDGAVPAGTPVLDEWARRNKEVRALLVAIEEGEPEITALWRETREWSLAEFQEIYAWLEATFDHFFYESEVADEGKELVQDAYRRGLLVESEGAVGANLDAEGLPFFMLIKSDGTGLYSTKDIALARRKFEQFRIDRSVYVVDVSQALHFQQVFATLKRLGFAQADKSHHLAYGMVVVPEGKMSSRKGNVVPFVELKDQLVGYVRREHLEKQSAVLSEAEMAEAARRVAIATIRYGMLNQDNNKNIVFDLAEWSAPAGNTGPYLLYAYARFRSILRKLGAYDAAQADFAQLRHEAELELLKTAQRFPQVMETAAASYAPQQVCIYLYGLARDSNAFFNQCPVLQAENEGLKAARAALIDAASRLLARGLELIGIGVIERM